MKYIDSKNTFFNHYANDLKEIKKVHTNQKSGYIDNTYYPFYPGIFVCSNEVHTNHIYMKNFNYKNDIFLINYCISGRCEFHVTKDKYLYMKNNYTSIGTLTITDSFYYPTVYYLGFEIYICEDLLTDETKAILENFNIDLDKLKQKYDNDEHLTLLETNNNIQHLWLEIHNHKNPPTGLIRLNILKILYELLNEKNVERANSSYLTKNQAKIAKHVHDILTADISKHIPIREISTHTSISETSLKNYFNSMYGMNVSDYMRILRLKKAAELLLNTNISIAEISEKCGYSNQGRFAKAFKEHFGLLPLEYRHSKI
ncbi:AraC family transcriptional regulator [Eubacterium sp.]|uniref:helix-turn-helix domain-containing protein n=1 Tax=Eubacterium sp. TaxID=142586 RepID=UPI0025F1B373|nr:AraC family transcriptional regulator [Eubacterium sp.]MCR5629583.1 AraC family transcriptional regulator [Eubacterium sp.]